MTHESVPSRLPLGISLSLLAYIFFVAASSLVFSLKRGHFPVIQVIFIQNCVCFLCNLPVALRMGPQRLKTNVLHIHLIRDASGVLSYYLYFVAIRFLNLTDATVLNYTAPFFVPFVWWVWVKEKIDLHIWWSIIIGFLGVAVILNPTTQIFETGFVYGLFAGVVSSIAFCALRLINVKKEPTSRTLFYYFLFGSLFTAPFAWFHWLAPNSLEWSKLIGIGLCTSIAQILLTMSYRHGTASYLSPLGYVTVVYAAIASSLIFHVSMSLRSIIGTILIVFGGTLTYLLKKKPALQSLEVQKSDEQNPSL